MVSKSAHMWRGVAAAMLLSISHYIYPSALGQTKPQALRSELLVSAEWLENHIYDKDLVLLHVARDRAQYDAGHIPGARFLAWSEIVASRDGVPNEMPPIEKLAAVFTSLGVGNSGRIVLYGDNTGLSAARAFVTLDYLGHGDRCSLLDGGLEKWKADGRAVSTDATSITPSVFTPKPVKTVITDLASMRRHSDTAVEGKSAKVVLLDSRPADQYKGEGGAGAGPSGHVPGATNLYWMNHLVSRDNPVLRSAAELQQMFDDAGVRPGDKVVTYCNSGVQASYSYFIAKYLGFDVTLYDGSMSEWGRTEGAKTVTGGKPK